MARGTCHSKIVAYLGGVSTLDMAMVSINTIASNTTFIRALEDVCRIKYLSTGGQPRVMEKHLLRVPRRRDWCTALLRNKMLHL